MMTKCTMQTLMIWYDTNIRRLFRKRKQKTEQNRLQTGILKDICKLVQGHICVFMYLICNYQAASWDLKLFDRNGLTPICTPPPLA